MITFNGVKFNGVKAYEQMPLLYTLTIDSSKVDSDLTDFPLLVHLGTEVGTTSADISDIFTEVGSASGKISIQTTGGTELDVEVESWDADNQEAYLWVKVPSILAASDTTLNLYYGANRTVSTKVYEHGSIDARTIWQDHHAVYHMTSNGTTVLNSASSYNLTPNNAAATGEGIINGILLDGVDDYLNTTPEVIFSMVDFSYSCWFKYQWPSPTTYTEQNIVSMRSSANTPTTDRPIYEVQMANYTGWNNNKPWLYTRHGFFSGSDLNIIGALSAEGGTGDVGDGNWHQVTIVRKRSTDYCAIYIDGVLGITPDPYPYGSIPAQHRLGSGTCTPYDPSNPADLRTNIHVGNAERTLGNAFGGSVDEVRIANKALTPEEIKATYYSEMDNLITFN